MFGGEEETFARRSPLAPRKHSRRSSLGALVRLLVFSLAFVPFLCRRQRGRTLPPARGAPGAVVRVFERQKRKKHAFACFFMAEKRRLSRGDRRLHLENTVAGLRLERSSGSLFSHSRSSPSSAAGSGDERSLLRGVPPAQSFESLKGKNEKSTLLRAFFMAEKRRLELLRRGLAGLRP